MANQPIFPKDAATPIAPYSPGVKIGNVIYTSGILPIGSDGGVVGKGDIAAQTHYVLETIKSIIEEADGIMSDVVFNTIFIKNLAEYQQMNSVYKTFFDDNSYPARYCVQANLVKPEFLVEIASIAHL